MKAAKYLIISGKPDYIGGPVSCNGARIATRKVGLKSTERAFKLNLDIPDELFLEPEINIDVVVPTDQVNRKAITAETLNNVTEVMKQELGANINITLVTPKVSK